MRRLPAKKMHSCRLALVLNRIYRPSSDTESSCVKQLVEEPKREQLTVIGLLWLSVLSAIQAQIDCQDRLLEIGWRGNTYASIGERTSSLARRAVRAALADLPPAWRFSGLRSKPALTVLFFSPLLPQTRPMLACNTLTHRPHQ